MEEHRKATNVVVGQPPDHRLHIVEAGAGDGERHQKPRVVLVDVRQVFQDVLADQRAIEGV